MVFGEKHVCRILKAYASYYNEVRIHLSQNKDAPEFRQRQKIGRIAASPAGSIINTSGLRLDRQRP
jgi:hypothetical protein